MDDPLQELKVVEEGRPHVQSAHPRGCDQKQWSGGPQGVREHKHGSWSPTPEGSGFRKEGKFETGLED